MQNLISLIESWFGALPLPLLELWGRFSYAIGAVLAICAYGRFTFRRGGAWQLGHERQTWNARAFLGAGLSFALVPLAGWVGSGIVLVEGAQTFESLKDLMVFLCIVLFGYPALVAIPPAYMLSDLIEGVPPGFVLNWFEGYFFWAAFVWVAYQFIGHNPDFKRPRTWAWYGLFVFQLMLFDPAMWGYICSAKFSAGISYREITPALAFTLLITWAMGPFCMLGALPLARRYGMFWAEIPGHVKVRSLGRTRPAWTSGQAQRGDGSQADELPGIPLRIVLALSFITVVLAVSGTVAYLALRSGEDAADKLALRLHQEISDNIDIRMDDYLEHASGQPEAERVAGLDQLLGSLPIAHSGRAFVADGSGRVLAASIAGGAADPVIVTAMEQLRARVREPAGLRKPLEFRFDVLTARPLSRETWLARATPYTDKPGRVRWAEVTAMPESYYLADLQEGNGRMAMLCAIALCVAMLGAGLLAALVAAPTRRITRAAEAMAAGDLSQRVAGSRLAEMGALVNAFNRMAEQLQQAFRRSLQSENTLKAIFSASPVAMAVFKAESIERTQMDMQRGREIADVNEAWERITGHRREDIIGRSSTVLNLWAEDGIRRAFTDLLFQHGSVDAFEARMRRADGSEYFASNSARDVVVGDERLSIFAVEDITPQKRSSAQLQAMNRQLSALLDAAMEVAIIATDREGRITVFNSGAQNMLHYSEAEMLGQPVLMLHLPGDVAACAHEFTGQPGAAISGGQLYAGLTKEGASAIRNWIFQRKDSALVQVSMALSVVHDEHNETIGYLGIARDITEQLAAQAEMIELNMTLDQRVRERTLALQESKEQLEQALDHLRRMQTKLVQSEKLAGLGNIVAAVAHELNTPIGNCITVASTLHEETGKINADMAGGSLRRQRLADYLGSMVEGTALLQRALLHAADLVENFKRVAVDQGSSSRRSFELHAAVDDAMALLRPSLRKTPYQIEIAVPQGLVMDSFPGALEQVISNLVNNAVMHGFADRAEGRMRLTAEQSGERVRLLFSDDGHGMAASTISRIFDPFFTTALGKGGSGLGMNITYNLVTGLLGGDIEVSSELGQGSTFTILLPLVAPERTEQADGD